MATEGGLLVPSQPLILGRRGQAKVDTDTTGTRVQTSLLSSFLDIKILLAEINDDVVGVEVEQTNI